MKNLHYFSKSRLLFTLIALFMGISSSWAANADFEESLPTGWETVGTMSYFERPYTGFYSIGNSSNSGWDTNRGNYIKTTTLEGEITLWMRSYKSNTTGYVVLYELSDDGNTLGNKLITYSSSSTTFAEKTYTLTEPTRLAIVINYAHLDNMTYTEFVEVGPKKPTNLSVSDITINSATLSWNKGEETDAAWQVVYSTDENFDKDAATKYDVSSTSYNFTGLSDNTTYYAAVRTYAGSGEGKQSKWVSKSFKTLRAPISTFPWSENFNAITSGIPDGWDNSEGTTSSASYKWTSYSSGHDGRGLRFDSYNNSSNNTNFLKTPVMAFTQNAPMQLKFWYKNPAGGDFSVYISNDGGATYTKELATDLTGTSEWTEKVIDLPTDEYYSNVVIVFKGTSNWGSGDAYIYLDDILVKENASYAMSISGDDVVSNSIDFGEVKNTSTTKTFTITNDGAETLTGISVVSSDASVFTVSETGFDLASGATKDITVTFVKGVVGSYNETITISQANTSSDLMIAVTASYATPAVAQMAVKLGEEAVGETVAFGSVGKAVTKTFTLENAGEADLTITSIVSSNTTDFTVSPATLTVHGGESETFTVTFVWDGEAMNAEKTANITVTPSNDNLSPVTFAVTGTRIEQWSEDFSGNALPEGWETTSTTYWTFADGVAKGSYPGSTAYYLITPSLIVDGTSASLSFDYAATGNYTSIIIQKSKDGGDWENCTTTPTIGSLNTGNSGTATITGLESGNYKFRFKADSYNLDNFEGFKRNLNDPKLGIYTDAGCTVATTTSVTKDFDFVTTEQTVNYYIKNDGTGTMTLSKGDVPAGFTATLDKTSVASGEHATLTITMPAENKGYHSGNLVITATDLGTFTVALSGVMVDDTKLNLNFATDNIPSTWTANSWTKNNDGYMEVGYTASTIQTSTLNAAVNEQLVVVAKQSYTSSSYTFGVKYREVGTETWNDLIAAANIGTSWVTLAATIETAGAYELQFTGNYTQIKRIYGLTEPNEPVMVVYDGESVAGDAYDFGNVPDDDDAVWTLTVKNEGKSVLTGLAAELTGTNAAHYSYEITGATGTNSDEIQPNATATITVKQLKDYLGDHEATLTISATGLDSKVITLSGTTRDHTKLFVDFDNPNSIPEGWKAGTSWSVYTYGTDRYAQQTNYNTASALVTTPLIVAANETLKFQAARYYSSSACELKVRYTTDGGVSWSDYVDYSFQIASSSFVNLELTGVPEGTAVVEFYGRYVKLDNISGFAPTTAPMLALTEGNDAVASGDTKAFGNLTADGVATYTLTNNGNANMVSNVYAIGYAEVEISGEGEGVTLEKVNNSETYNKVTLEPGKSATLTLTVKYEAPFTEKNGEMVIETEGWVGDMTVNYTSNSIDPTAVYIDFADGKKPDGFYSNGWTYTSGYAANSNTTAAEFITSKLTVAGEDDIITFDARAAWDGYGEELIVEYSTAANNRAAWTEVKILSESDLTSTFQTFQIKGLDAGDYYLRFSGKRVYVDNIMGWHYAQPAAEHDLYVTSVYPEESILVPGTEITVTADVTSLIADEEGVYTKLYCRNADTSTSEVLVTSTTTEDISKDGTKTFTMTATLPNTEAHYSFSVGAFLSDGTEIMISKKSNLYNLQHTRTMEITEYTRTDGEGTLDADANNQISASFSVKVKNTGTAAAFPIVKIKVGDVVVGEATPDLILIPGNESAIDVNLNNISAFEGGELNFVAEAYWNATDAEPKAVSDPIVITVNAVAPKFALYTYPGDTPVNDGDDVDFGLIKQMTAHNYVIKNEGNKDMEFVGITCPEGFSATSILDEGKKIVAANGGYLAFDVYMDYNVGRKNGQLVITYKVDESTNKTFTLNLSGRSVSADTWTEPFDNTYTAIPGNWTNNGWQVASESSDYPGTAYSYNETATLMTPRLAAAEGEVLTFDVASNSYGFTYAYSTDGGATWSDEINVAAGTTGEQSFTAPAEGNYYLRFTGRYGYLRNFVGFKLSSLGDLTLLDTEDFGDNIELGRYETVTVSRTFNKGWGTVVLPFDVDAATVQAKFGEGTKLYTLSDFNATTGDIQFSPVYNGKIAAGTPYLINIPEAIDNGITFENVTVVADVNDKVLDNGAEFHGNYDAGMSMVDLFGITPEGKIAKGVGSSTMKAYRAYMVLPGNVDPNNARLVIFDETTGISRVLNDVELENTNIYNLNGQRVNKSAKGILLINGKKVMIK